MEEKTHLNEERETKKPKETKTERDKDTERDREVRNACTYLNIVPFVEDTRFSK